jgi:hypothetical protein
MKLRSYQHVLKTATKGEIVVDGVVAGIDEYWTCPAGLKTENGIVVDEFLPTRHPDIYAGDVAAFAAIHTEGSRKAVAGTEQKRVRCMIEKRTRGKQWAAPLTIKKQLARSWTS